MKAELETSMAAAQKMPRARKKNSARGRGRPVGDRSGQRTKLLRSVITTVVEEGYAGASIRKVAKRAGFTTGAVAYYFDNKAAMMIAATEYLWDEFDLMLREQRDASDLGEVVERWMTRWANAELWFTHVQLLAFASQEPRCAEVFERRYGRFREDYIVIVEGWQKSGSIRRDLSAELIVDQLCAIFDGWTMSLPVEPKRFSAERLPKLVDALIALFGPSPSCTTGAVL